MYMRLVLKRLKGGDSTKNAKGENMWKASIYVLKSKNKLTNQLYK